MVRPWCSSSSTKRCRTAARVAVMAVSSLPARADRFYPPPAGGRTRALLLLEKNRNPLVPPPGRRAPSPGGDVLGQGDHLVVLEHIADAIALVQAAAVGTGGVGD